MTFASFNGRRKLLQRYLGWTGWLHDETVEQLGVVVGDEEELAGQRDQCENGDGGWKLRELCS